MLSKRANTGYVLAKENVLIFPTFNAKNNNANAPNKTNTPTQKSKDFLCITQTSLYKAIYPAYSLLHTFKKNNPIF
jgi:hypothetical protein